jgi:hypothetical protein
LDFISAWKNRPKKKKKTHFCYNPLKTQRLTQLLTLYAHQNKGLRLIGLFASAAGSRSVAGQLTAIHRMPSSQEMPGASSLDFQAGLRSDLRPLNTSRCPLALDLCS